MFQRTAGVLLPAASLPGPYGAGVFGAEAAAFAERIASAGFHFWQLLPLVPPGSGDSPYSSPSAFAGSPWYIDPRQLADDGLLTKKEADGARYPGEPYTADYDFLRASRLPLLRLAFSRLDTETERLVDAFARENEWWLTDYSLYMAMKEKNGGRAHWEWKDAPPAAELRARQPEEASFWRFVQYEFRRQWDALREKLRTLGVSVLGDVPIYVSHDSADFWAHPELFQTDGHGGCAAAAGVPPDAFNADGQLWGNPLYDWDAMEKDGYSWWIRRLAHSLGLFDAVRIDHFRGFESYFSVPAGAENARAGVWEKGPGMKLFRAARDKLGEMAVVAEDLGVIGDDVRRFVAESGFPGMRVLQFAFDGSPDSPHLPHNHSENYLACTGTHDNDTALGWLWSLSPEVREEALFYCGFTGSEWGAGGPRSPAVRALLRCVWQSPARLAVVPAQDLCGFGRDTRVNTPGVPDGNWRWRLTDEALAGIDTAWYARLNRAFRRDHPLKQPVL